MAIMILLALGGSAIPFKEILFGAASPVVSETSATPVPQASRGRNVRLDGLPQRPPSLPALGSRFSTLLRARDVLQLERTPATAVAKLFRLDQDGKRTATACTATFIGPRHLITAGHCLVDRSSGIAHPGFELAPRYDAGKSLDGATARVVRAWVPSSHWKIERFEDELVSADRCTDYGIVEIAESARSTTWLGLAAAPAPGLLHRFSYPHRPTRGTFSVPDGADAELRKSIAAEEEESDRSEPAFRATDLFYEYGGMDIVQPSHLAETGDQPVNGQSGSALLDRTGAIVAILSRHYDRTAYNCRLRRDEIGAIAAILRNAAQER